MNTEVDLNLVGNVSRLTDMNQSVLYTAYDTSKRHEIESMGI